MLRYLGTGLRNYAHNPIRAGRRGLWEFQAVLSGRIAWTTAAGPSRYGCVDRRLWLFPPNYTHGWTGDGDPAEVVVFHYPWIPDGLDRVAYEDGPLTMPLTDGQIDHLRRFGQIAGEHLRRPRASSTSRHLFVLAWLSQMMWDSIGDRQLANPREMDRQRVEDALSWYRQHLYLAPTVQEVAEAVFCSLAHLRRLFHQHCHCSPAQALLQQRLRRAQELISAGSMSLAAVAKESGFRSQAVFTRVFKSNCGVAPSRWRSQTTHRSGSLRQTYSAVPHRQDP
ncbi:MAG: AraC family transcriptional regulator [Planctomycetota bacterium]|nr:MAG: AraC family transcriptional regulator [Planctomycetota bacterium]